MELLNVENYEEIGTAIALGNFDGVHIGHQQLIKKVINISKIKGLKSSVLLFKNHTRTLVDSNGPLLLSSYEQKNSLIENLGIDIIYTMPFNEEFRKLSPEEFFTNILIKKLNVRTIVVGVDYRFGYKASGDSNVLLKLGEKFGVEVIIFNPIYFEGSVVSSTRIRECLLSGNIRKANKMLGRDYSIIGEVVRGKEIGHKLGFPTANIKPSINYVIPKNGVYSTETIVEDIRYLSATSVGYNPTFMENEIKIESHIIDFNDLIYNKTIELIFVEYLREEMKFNNIESLKKQILEDIKKVKLI
jgi:riboflavin kinase/FMN adenylyltransferase